MSIPYLIVYLPQCVVRFIGLYQLMASVWVSLLACISSRAGFRPLSCEAKYNINILPYCKVHTGQSSHDVNALLGGFAAGCRQKVYGVWLRPMCGLEFSMKTLSLKIVTTSMYSCGYGQQDSACRGNPGSPVGTRVFSDQPKRYHAPIRCWSGQHVPSLHQ